MYETANCELAYENLRTFPLNARGRCWFSVFLCLVVRHGGAAWWCGMVVRHGGAAWWCGMVVLLAIVTNIKRFVRLLYRNVIMLGVSPYICVKLTSYV